MGAEPNSNADFGETYWPDIIKAGQGSEQALEEWCAKYWPPLYAFLRREGSTREEAKDLVQGFLMHFIAKRNRLLLANPAKGRFRAYLKQSIKNYKANEYKKEQKSPHAKGKTISISELEIDVWEGIFKELSDQDSPDRIYVRTWAKNITHLAMNRVRARYIKKGKKALFEALEPHLLGDSRHGDLAAVTVGGLGPGGVRSALLRMRKYYVIALREEVGSTVSEKSEVDPEIQEIIAALAG